MATSVHTSTPRTWVAGEVVSATQLNTEVRDAMLDLQDDWDAWTPNWNSSGTNPTVGNATLTGAYRQIGKTVWFRIALNFGSTSSPGTGTWNFSLPALPNTSYPSLCPMGDAVAYDLSASAGYARTATLYGTTRVQALGGSNERIGAGAPFVWAGGDTLQFMGLYEAA